MIVTYSAFRERLADYMDEVTNNRTALHVTRQGSRSVVVIDEAEYDSMVETLHLMRSPANARRLVEAMADADAGKLSEFDSTARSSNMSRRNAPTKPKRPPPGKRPERR